MSRSSIVPTGRSAKSTSSAGACSRSTSGRRRTGLSSPSFSPMCLGPASTIRSRAPPGIISAKAAGCATRSRCATTFISGSATEANRAGTVSGLRTRSRHSPSPRGDWALAADLLPDLVANFDAWARSRRDPEGLFWQADDRDGMEYSIGGSGYRPTINSYQFGDAAAIARIAARAGRTDLVQRFQREADTLRTLVDSRLWDPGAQFYKTLPRGRAHPGRSARGNRLRPLVFRSSRTGARSGVGAARRLARLRRAVWPHDRRAEGPAVHESS